MTRHPNNEVVFAGTARGLEARGAAGGLPAGDHPGAGAQGQGLARAAAGLLALPLRASWSFRILVRHKPDVVVGVGATRAGRWCSRGLADGHPHRGAGAERAAGLHQQGAGQGREGGLHLLPEALRFPAAKVRLIGNPIRRKLMDNYLRSSVAHDGFNVLVFGGSLGAKALNARMIEAAGLARRPQGPALLRAPDGQEGRGGGARGLRSRGFKAQVSRSSSRTCPPRTRARSWWCAARARRRWRSSPCARRRASWCPSPTRRTTTRR